MRTRICSNCGKEEDTHSKVEMCARCCFDIKKQKRVDAERNHLTLLGYTVLETLDVGQGKYRVLAPCCGCEFTPKYGNVVHLLAKNGKPPCRKCGGRERALKAQAGFKAKYSRTPGSTNYQDRQDYDLMVRRLTEVNYQANQATLNPLKLERTVDGWHLDHKVPVSVCFDEGISVEHAASPRNLELVPASDNLKKSKFTFDLALLEELR